MIDVRNMNDPLRDPAQEAADLPGGPVSPPEPSTQSAVAFLDVLQQLMEEIALGARQNHGRFCGNCYAELGEAVRRKPSRLPAAQCEICGAWTDDVQPADHVPDEVLSIYLAKRKREGLFVNLFAFSGIFLSIVLSAASWLWLPDNWWRVLPFAILVFGSYYLARLIGYDVGVPLGSRSGRRLRDRRWRAFELARGSGPLAAEERLDRRNG